MPKVKIRLATGVVVPSRRRAGLIIHAGQPQEFDVTDEQYLTLLDDNKLQVTEVADEEVNEDDAFNARTEKIEAAATEGLVLEVTGENTDEEVDAAIEAARALKENTENQPGGNASDAAANTQSAQAAGEGVQNNETTVTPGEGENDAKGNVEQPQAPVIPTTEAAIKKQGRDVVVEQAKSLGIELDYADEKATTKAVIAAAIVAKQKEA